MEFNDEMIKKYVKKYKCYHVVCETMLKKNAICEIIYQKLKRFLIVFVTLSHHI